MNYKLYEKNFFRALGFLNLPINSDRNKLLCCESFLKVFLSTFAGYSSVEAALSWRDTPDGSGPSNCTIIRDERLSYNAITKECENILRL